MAGSFFSNKAKRDALAKLTPEQRARIARADAEKTLARTQERAPKKPKDDETPPTYQIDILQHELDTGAPHWLKGERVKNQSKIIEERKQEIRDKHRGKAKKPPGK